MKIIIIKLYKHGQHKNKVWYLLVGSKMSSVLEKDSRLISKTNMPSVVRIVTSVLERDSRLISKTNTPSIVGIVTSVLQ